MARQTTEGLPIITIAVVVIVIIVALGAYYVIDNKFLRYTDISSITKEGRYTFKASFSGFGYAGAEGNLPFVAALMLFSDKTGTVVIGEIGGKSWVEPTSYALFILARSQLLEDTWVLEAEVVQVGVIDIYENIAPIIEGVLITINFSDDTMWKRIGADAILKVNNFHKAGWLD